MLVAFLTDVAQNTLLTIYVLVEYPFVLEVLGLAAVKAGLDRGRCRCRQTRSKEHL